jgi:hypothetical protein
MAGVVLRVRLTGGDHIDGTSDEPDTIETDQVIEQVISTLAEDSGLLRSSSRGDRLVALFTPGVAAIETRHEARSCDRDWRSPVRAGTECPKHPAPRPGRVTPIKFVDQPHRPAQLLEIISLAGFARFVVEFANLLDFGPGRRDGGDRTQRQIRRPERSRQCRSAHRQA